MTSTSQLEILEAWQCRVLLQAGSLGRIAFTDRALPAIRPLNYTTVGNRIMLRLVGDDLGARLDGQVVAFEVDDVDLAGHVGWSVLVLGTVQLLREGSELLRTATLPPSWAGPGHRSAACLTVGEISGRRLRPAWPSLPRDATVAG